jgi:hypothetical protein
MRIIETVLPACNSAGSLDDKFDSSALIHNILRTVPDYALIPSRLPLRFDLVACRTIEIDRECAQKFLFAEEVLPLAQA